MEQRVTHLNRNPVNNRGRCVIYWMEAAQRAKDNLALIYAIEQANLLLKPLICYFGVDESLPTSSARLFSFMLSGIEETAAALEAKGIPFVSRLESPADGIQRLEMEIDPCLVVVDEASIHYGRQIRRKAASRFSVPLIEVDSEPVIPLRAWPGEMKNAAAMRTRATSLWRQHLQESPLAKLKMSGRRLRVPRRIELNDTEAMDLVTSLKLRADVAPSPILKGGIKAAEKQLKAFINKRLPAYANDCEQPGVEGTSGLSPYLRFGQIWAGRIALEVKKAKGSAAAKKAFLEKLLLERELAMNFCLHNPEHHSPAVMADWARQTLDAHRKDPRPFIYSREELETASTHDSLWNAAQQELLVIGRIHPALRSLWAKKILEWSASPEEAWETAVYLNDKYALDGCDASGYFNIARCLGGVSEKPRKERPVFGRLPYLASDRLMKKIDFRSYMARIQRARRLAGLPENSS
ncbi:MAG: deoxyribodipyrimidine photolyase [Armatimonadetes bacterium]|nr:deoxyribodipyrimidine photolyase [Armatimonadota bacterium]NIO75117.1 deoxyribodipyrimidine photolyase [Armatimonadota bacterium]NIO95741.1 deoxyribodipyrimidine photolyase [Armatimonadota bacterium]